MDIHRCFDCFADIGPSEPRFAVLKKMRDMPPDFIGCDEARSFTLHACLDPQVVCAECAGWYDEDAIEITNEAG